MMTSVATAAVVMSQQQQQMETTSSPNVSVHIGNIDYGVDDVRLRVELERAFGRVRTLRIGRDRKTGKSLGYAFVEFVDNSVASSALQTRTLVMNGRRARISVAEPRRRRNATTVEKRQPVARTATPFIQPGRADIDALCDLLSESIATIDRLTLFSEEKRRRANGTTPVMSGKWQNFGERSSARMFAPVDIDAVSNQYNDALRSLSTEQSSPSIATTTTSQAIDVVSPVSSAVRALEDDGDDVPELLPASASSSPPSPIGSLSSLSSSQPSPLFSTTPPPRSLTPIALRPQSRQLSDELRAHASKSLPDFLGESSSNGCSRCPLHGSAGGDASCSPGVESLLDDREALVECVGYADTTGRRSSMEDWITIAGQFRSHVDEHFFAVYDGHGGRAVAKMAGQRLHAMFEQQLQTNADAESALAGAFEQFESFIECDQELGAPGDILSPWNLWRAEHAQCTGSTALAVYIRGDQCYVANAGDCRAVLGGNLDSMHGVGTELMRVRRLTTDHKPCEPDEERRIRSAGGWVTSAQTRTGEWISRINGQLSVARAFGDTSLRPFVTHRPDTYVFSTSAYDTLVIACDGVWDVLSDDDAMRVAMSEPSGCPSRAAEAVVRAAFSAGSQDNISVLVVRFK